MAAPVPIWKGYSGLVEVPQSGTFRAAERVSFTQVFEGKYSDGFTYWNARPRGSAWTFTVVGVSADFVVEESTLELVDKGGRARITTLYLYLGSVPPDEWSMVPFEINPAIERHTFFSTLTQEDLRKAKALFNAATAAGQTAIQGVIASTTNATLTTNLVNKWLRGEETFYLAGFKFQHTLYFTSAPTTSEGGFIQTPTGAFSGYIPGGMSWLRQADELIWSNGLWKLTRTWIGAPGGWWDTDLY
jgi:hypothetical protein